MSFKDQIHIMVDIETLGLNANHLIFQIAACKFEINTGNILDTFNGIVNITNEEFLVHGNTLLWWLNTNKELLTRLLNNGYYNSEKILLESFRTWIFTSTLGESAIYNMENVLLWGNGILFDNCIIETKMEKYGMNYPINYRNDRDLRTFIEMAAFKSGYKSEKDFREANSDNLIKHDALNDCKNQIKALSKAWNILN